MRSKTMYVGLVLVAFMSGFHFNMSTTTSSNQAFAQTSLPRVALSNLVYQGAFRVPGSQVGPGPNDYFEYANEGIAYNSANNSLFIKCKGANLNDTTQQHVAEVNIPALVNSTNIGSLNTGTVRQNCADITQNHLNPQGIANGMTIGGLLVHNNKLIGSEWAYYDGGADQTTSHFSHSLTLSQTGTYQGQYALTAPFAAYVGGYMTPIPSEWQSAFGGPALTGHCCTSIISHQSTGPSAFVFDPNNLGAVNPVPATPVVYYNMSYPTLGTWDHPLPANPVYSISTLITGIVFPAGTRSVMFFGRTGMGSQCYGDGVASGSNIDGTQCYDPNYVGWKGTHSYPYAYYVWMYDANDMVAVKNGTKHPWDITPYYHGTVTLPFASGAWRPELNGAAYDPATKRIYISQYLADNGKPIIHAFQVNVGTLSVDDTTPPSPPTALKVQ
jgi:hypothetical protein